MIVRRKMLASLTALAIAAVTAGLTALVASAETGRPAECSSPVKHINYDMGDKTPIIMVHGLNGDAKTWRYTTLWDLIEKSPRLYVAANFEFRAKYLTVYPNLRKLRDGYNSLYDSADRLARTTNCVSAVSKQNGGTGKVIVAGYSLGGLLTHLALKPSEVPYSGDMPDVTKKVGLVITVADAWRSYPFVKAPEFDKSIPVLAMAGNVIRQRNTTKGLVYNDTQSDDWVKLSHATTQGNTIGPIGGVYVRHCKRDMKWWPFGLDTARLCSHENLLENPNIMQHMFMIMGVADRKFREDSQVAVNPTPTIGPTGGWTGTYAPTPPTSVG